MHYYWTGFNNSCILNKYIFKKKCWNPDKTRSYPPAVLARSSGKDIFTSIYDFMTMHQNLALAWYLASDTPDSIFDDPLPSTQDWNEYHCAESRKVRWWTVLPKNFPSIVSAKHQLVWYSRSMCRVTSRISTRFPRMLEETGDLAFPDQNHVVRHHVFDSTRQVANFVDPQWAWWWQSMLRTKWLPLM